MILSLSIYKWNELLYKRFELKMYLQNISTPLRCAKISSEYLKIVYGPVKKSLKISFKTCMRIDIRIT